MCSTGRLKGWRGAAFCCRDEITKVGIHRQLVARQGFYHQFRTNQFLEAQGAFLDGKA